MRKCLVPKIPPLPGLLCAGSGGTISRFREHVSSEPGHETLSPSMKPFFARLGKLLKPAFGSIEPAGRTKGSIMWTLISILYRAYCRARLLEMRRYHLAG